MSADYESHGLILRIEQACKDIAMDLAELVGRPVSYDDGVTLIDSLYYCKADLEDTISDLELVLNDDAVIH